MSTATPTLEIPDQLDLSPWFAGHDLGHDATIVDQYFLEVTAADVAAEHYAQVAALTSPEAFAAVFDDELLAAIAGAEATGHLDSVGFLVGDPEARSDAIVYARQVAYDVIVEAASA